MSIILNSIQNQHQYVQQKIQKLLPSFRISQFLTNFSKFFSNSKFNLLYAEKKFRIYYKSTLGKKKKLQSKNIQTVPNYQFKYQSFKHERGKPEI